MHNNNDECDKRVPAKNDSSSKKPTGLFHDTFSFFGFLRFIRLFRIDAKNTEIKINSSGIFGMILPGIRDIHASLKILKLEV